MKTNQPQTDYTAMTNGFQLVMPLDREYAANIMGFYGATANSMDGVSDRDYVIELLSALSIVMMHLSRFC